MHRLSGRQLHNFFRQATGKLLVASLLPKVHCERIPGPSDDDLRRRLEQPHLHLCKAASSILMQNRIEQKKILTQKLFASVGDPFCRSMNLSHPLVRPFFADPGRLPKGASVYANWLRVSLRSHRHRSAVIEARTLRHSTEA